MTALVALVAIAILYRAYKENGASDLSQLPEPLQVGQVLRGTSIDATTASPAVTYDSFVPLDALDCSVYSNIPSSTVQYRFAHLAAKNRIVAFSEFAMNGVTHRQTRELFPCEIVDSANWRCGGDSTLIGPRVWRKHTYVLTDGELTLENAGYEDQPRSCPTKLVRR